MRKDAQENRQEILRVARFLIAQQGSDVSLRTIASTAGVGIATLYRNFPTREDLLLGIVRETAEEAEAAIAECLECRPRAGVAELCACRCPAEDRHVCHAHG